MWPYTVASIIGYFPNEVYLLLCLFYSSVDFFLEKALQKVIAFSCTIILSFLAL